MKNILLFSTLLCFAQIVFAQSFTTKFSSGSGEKKIKVLISDSEVSIASHNSSEVVISTDDYEAPPERAKGLRPLYNNAADNTGIGLEVTESGNEITIKKASSHNMNFEIKIPKSANVYVVEEGWHGDGINVKDVTGEIEIDAKGSSIKIANAVGPVVANTVNGSIEITFATVNQDQPNSISCTNGFIDVTLPKSTKSDLKMKSINGEVYTNFDIDLAKKKEGMHLISGHKLAGTINGGGVEMSLQAINGDIYLRKAE